MVGKTGRGCKHPAALTRRGGYDPLFCGLSGALLNSADSGGMIPLKPLSGTRSRFTPVFSWKQRPPD